LVFKPLIGLISFLTIIPVANKPPPSEDGLGNIAKNMHLFPIIGLVIGVTGIPITIISFYFLNHLISGLLITIFLVIITGVHHTDALADFADGIMVKGNIEKKYKAIHDPMIGSAGVVAVSSYLLGMTVAVSSFTGIERLVISLVMSEIGAKYTMVLQAFLSESAWEGHSSPFTKSMKSQKKIIVSTAIAVILMAVVGQSIQLLSQVFVTGIICCFVITYIAKKSFGGVTGDVMGATNEIVRLCCLISSTTT
jgi:adenosylcobinamide-GDP ribazoletransferase